MAEHKHASVLRAIADGVPMSEFEAEFISGMWRPLGVCAATNRGDACGWIESPDKWEIRRKPQYIMVNGFKVPKPLDVMPEDGDVYGASPSGSSFFATGNPKYEWSRIMIARGILHSTQAAAIAHAKAMLGIDPKWEE